MITIDGTEIAIAGVTYALGWAVGRRRRVKTPARPAAPVGPVCQCSHLYAFHAPDTQVCQHTETKYEKVSVAIRNKGGNVVTDAYGDVQFQTELTPVTVVACRCQRYTGPDPLPTVVDLT